MLQSGNQLLAMLADVELSLTKAQLRHSQCALVTENASRAARNQCGATHGLIERGSAASISMDPESGCPAVKV